MPLKHRRGVQPAVVGHQALAWCCDPSTAGIDECITSTCQRTPGRAGVTQLRHSAAVPYGA